MSDLLKIAEKQILAPAGISHHEVEKCLGSMMGGAIDNADMYFQTTVEQSWIFENGILKEGSFDKEQGVGVRAISGEKTGFAYSDDIILPALDEAAHAAGSIARHGGGHVQAFEKVAGHNLYPTQNPIGQIPEEEIILLLQTIDEKARKEDPRVNQVIINLTAEHEVIMVVSSDGRMAADVRPLVRLNVSVIVEDKGQREQATAGGGGRGDYQYFLQDERGVGFAKEAVRQAITNLDAVAAPAGTMPVVLGPGWPGVLLHEAVGHGLEGDFIRKGTSAFTGRLGERVATPGVTVMDDGTLAGRRGSLNMDDEGTPTQCTTLIEDGILKGFMQDSLNARLMKTQSTGNGRRESYAHLPMPRMTNTYMLAGPYAPEEIIKSVKKGLYAVNFGGGQVDITSGKFVFSASEAYLIEDGKITKPVKGATLIGDGPDVLTKVSMIGNDLKLDSGIGVCGKQGQSVPVGVGQPTLKVDELTVGGTSS